MISKQVLLFKRMKVILVVLFVLIYVTAICFYSPVFNRSHLPIFFGLIFLGCFYPLYQANYLFFVKERHNQERRALLKKYMFTVNFGVLAIIMTLLIYVFFLN